MNYKEYLADAFALMIERANDARERRERARSEQNVSALEYQSGRAQAYYEVICALDGRLEDYGISRGDIGLPKDWDTDQLL